jgi:hypothetical protein
MAAAVGSLSARVFLERLSFVAWIEQPPGHRSHVIEDLDRTLSSRHVHDPGAQEEPEVAVDFFGGGISDSPVMKSVPAGPAVTFSKVGGY